KRKRAARDERAPPWLSIVGWFCQLPWQESGASNVAPGGCPLVVVAARGLPATIPADGQNDSRHATTRGGPAGVETAAPSPRYDGPAQLFHGEPSDLPVR